MTKVDEHRPVGSGSRRETIVGVDREKVAATIKTLTPAANGKKTLRFRADTKKKLAEKKLARSGKDRRASTPASEVIVAVENTLDDMRRKNYRPLGLMEPDFVRFLLTVRQKVGQPRGRDGMP